MRDDPQRRAFTTAGPDDWADIDAMEDVGALVPFTGTIDLPDEWERREWDANRVGPKTLAEAAAAAQDREDPDWTVYGVDPAPQVHSLMGRTGLWPEWLPHAAALTGLRVLLEPGWNGRGHGGMRVLEGVVGHHTATSASAPGDYPSLRVVRDGRTGLPGPLAQFGLARSGAVIVIANGLAYHAGASAYAGFYDLNDEFLGIEAEHDGSGRWTPEQLDAYPRLVAALLYYMRRPAERYCSHRTCALPAGRKPDPAGILDARMHDQVRWYLADPLTRIPRTGTGEDDVSWSERLRSHTGYEAPAAEWLIGTNAKTDEAKAAAQQAAEGVGQLLARPPAAVDAHAVAEALATNEAFVDKLASRFATAYLDEQARRLAE